MWAKRTCRIQAVVADIMASNTIQSTKEPTKGEKADKPIDQPKPAAVLEEDDEFEDFPVEGKGSLVSSAV